MTAVIHEGDVCDTSRRKGLNFGVKNSEKLLKLIEGVYRYLPLGTIVNNKVLIVHGGISDSTDLEMIRSLDRGKYMKY
ncbi:hypothetical protein NQ317_008179 [Molorchus minor]|uniref:Calcineurin-like phosphoesterase domain-containing protein n=1 Tax=Molorchus minor TaxID=1323400 RepID=A0ABQ9JLM8_9CUCU|nr:hypothetical protein NQ317_008179 [Molorchus minor]